MSVKETFANRILELRNDADITRQELADKLGITRSSLEFYEKAKRTPDIEMITKIAQFFNVSVDYLFGLVDIPVQDESIKMVARYTGLNNDALNMLHLCSLEQSKDFVGTISKVVSAIDFLSLTTYIERAGVALNNRVEAMKNAIKFMKEHNAIGDSTVTSGVQESIDDYELQLFRATQSTIRITNQAYREEIKEISILEEEKTELYKQFLL